MKVTNSYQNSIPITTNRDLSNPADQIILLCHGFAGSITSEPISALYDLLAENHHVVMFPFIGKDSGYPSYTQCINDLIDVLLFLQSSGCSNIVLVGHSMGAGVALLVSTSPRTPQIISKLVLVSMPTDTKKFPEEHHMAMMQKGAMQFPVRIKNTIFYISREFLEDLQNHDLGKALQKLAIPTLVIQGNKDSVMTVANARWIYKTLELKRMKKLVIISGGGHLYKGKKIKKALALAIESFLINY